MSIQTILIVADIITFAAYGLAKSKLKPRIFRTVSIVTLAVYLAAILFITVFSRQPVSEIRWNVIPLLNFDFYIQFLPNVLVFIPVGFLLDAVLPRCKMVYTILIGIGISLCIEFVQLFVHVGICDIDDLIANSLGCVLGVFSACLLKHLL